jgi:hypothetical protein
MLTEQESLFGFLDAKLYGDGDGSDSKFELFSSIIPPDFIIITPDYEEIFKTVWFGKMDFTDLFVFSVPQFASFGSQEFSDFQAKMDLQENFFSRGSAQAKCYAYEMKFFEENLPCLN